MATGQEVDFPSSPALSYWVGALAFLLGPALVVLAMVLMHPSTGVIPIAFTWQGP